MNAKAIGAKLCKLRGEESQAVVAKKLGISPSALSMYESGNRIPRDPVKVKFAIYYNTTVEAIFFSG